MVTDTQNPHCDCIQLIGNTPNTTQDTAIAFKIWGNIIFPAGGRSHYVQCFFEDTGTHYVTLDCEFNVCITISAHGITYQHFGPNSIVRSNTWIEDQYPDISGITATPKIDVYNVTYPDSATSEIAYNIVELPTVALGEILNTTMPAGSNYDLTGLDDNTNYAAIFAGSDFSTEAIGTYTAFLTAMVPDYAGVPSLTTAGGVKIGAVSGYYDYTTGVSTAPWHEAGYNVANQFTDQTGLATTTLTTSNEITTSGVGANGVLVRVTSASGTFRVRDGSNNLVRNYSSSEYVVPNGYKVTLQNTTSGSASTTVNTVVTFGTRTDTWSITTA